MPLRCPLTQVLLVTVGRFVLGAVTFRGQGLAPDALSSVFNSPSGWALFTTLLVLAVRPRLLIGSVCGLVGFVALVLGYTVTAELAGLAYSPVFWGAVGVVTGPFVGAAAAAVRDPRPRARALGAGLLAAIALTDTVYGLTVVAASTSPVYWVLVGVVGVALLAVVGARLGSARTVGLMIAVAVALTALGTAAYAGLNAVCSLAA